MKLREERDQLKRSLELAKQDERDAVAGEIEALEQVKSLERKNAVLMRAVVVSIMSPHPERIEPLNGGGPLTSGPSLPDLMAEIEAEAEAEGDEAVAELAALRARWREKAAKEWK